MPLVLLGAALIQTGGHPLMGGTGEGSALVALERSAGGDTPVRTLRSARGPVKLLRDTGAFSSMPPPELNTRLGLASHPLSPAEFALAGSGCICKQVRPRRTLLPELWLPGPEGTPGVRLLGIEALELPVGALLASVDGVLGAPTLRRMPVWIDPFRDRLAWGTAALHAAATSDPDHHNSRSHQQGHQGREDQSSPPAPPLFARYPSSSGSRCAGSTGCRS